MDSIHILGIDLAKRTFAIRGSDLGGFDKQSKPQKLNYVNCTSFALVPTERARFSKTKARRGSKLYYLQPTVRRDAYLPIVPRIDKHHCFASLGILHLNDRFGSFRSLV